MTCDECDKAHEEEGFAPFRIGNKKIGWGVIIMKGCPKHLGLAFARLNEAQIQEGKRGLE